MLCCLWKYFLAKKKQKHGRKPGKKSGTKSRTSFENDSRASRWNLLFMFPGQLNSRNQFFNSRTSVLILNVFWYFVEGHVPLNPCICLLVCVPCVLLFSVAFEQMKKCRTSFWTLPFKDFRRELDQPGAAFVRCG